MDNRSDIWRHLQDHQIPPPQEVFERLQRTLDPPGDDDRSGLGRLQDHTVSPPAFLRIKVSEAAIPPGQGLLRRILPYAAAACVLLVIAGIVIDRSVSRQKPGPAVAQTSPAKINVPTQKDTAALSQTAAALPGSATDSSAKMAATGQGLSPMFTIDGDHFALVDNNPLLTFTSFRYPALTSYVDKNSTGRLKVRLDQYTNIVLSPAMTAMIKDLYGTRSTGTPTRRARKTKERLEKWKTADEEYFDGKALPGEIGSRNPLDPIDLAEFIFSSSGKLRSPATKPSPAAEAPDIHSAATDDLTVSYTLTLISKKRDNGIAETYNGGIETLFAGSGDSRGRLRLASLMRIQSAFLSPDNETITLLRESGKKKTSTRLTADAWARYNKKYLDLTCNLTDDTTSILGYVCKKASITLQDHRQIIAWYTPRIKKPACTLLEPAFSSLPGLVLQYEYAARKKTIRYTATAISRKPIDSAVFRLPAHP